MKLILCSRCQDVFKLQDFDRTCKCGKCGGRYLNDLDAVYWGSTALPIGFANSTLAEAVHSRPTKGNGSRFMAWVMPLSVPTMKEIDPPINKKVNAF